MTGSDSQELLTDSMRNVTKKVHAKSDRKTVIGVGVALTDRILWGRSIGWFYLVVSAIEQAIERSKDKAFVKDFYPHFVKLKRTEAFERDLEYYLGDAWKEKLTSPKAVESYISRIQYLEETEPLLVVTYWFHFLGALTGGGPIIRKMVTSSLRLQGDAGTQIFFFQGNGGKGFRDLKTVFNNLILTDQQRSQVLDESVALFSRNDQVVGCLSEFTTWRNIAMSIQSPPVQMMCGVAALLLFVIPLGFYMYKK